MASVFEHIVTSLSRISQIRTESQSGLMMSNLIGTNSLNLELVALQDKIKGLIL
jgi:hypothetical protein